MRRKDLTKLGLRHPELQAAAVEALKTAARSGLKKPARTRRLREVVDDPAGFEGDEHFGDLARKLGEHWEVEDAYVPRPEKAPYGCWGDDIDPEAIRQMENAVSLPVAARGALMPDAPLVASSPSSVPAARSRRRVSQDVDDISRLRAARA